MKNIKKIFFCIAGKKRKYIFASPLQRVPSPKKGKSSKKTVA